MDISYFKCPITFWTVYAWVCLIWIFFKYFYWPNRPTLEDVSSQIASKKVVDGAETREQSRKRNHRERLTTALFYVPFVPISCVVCPIVSCVFYMLMTFGALGEYLAIIAPLSDEELRKGKNFMYDIDS